MGADGRIHIWRDDKLREAWPSCDELFGRMQYVHHYCHELEGVRYHHLYGGSNAVNDWQEYEHALEEWEAKSGRKPMTESELRQAMEMREFVRWLKANATVWEVWT